MLYILLYIMKLFQINGSVVHPVHKCKVGADLQIFEKQICVSTRRRATTELSVLFFVFVFFFRFFFWLGGCPKGFVVLGVRHQHYGKALWLSKYKVVQE